MQQTKYRNDLVMLSVSGRK